MTSPLRSTRTQILLPCLALAAAYVLLGRLAFTMSLEYGNITSMIFIPEGVALTFCIVAGPRVAPGIFLGQTLLSLWAGLPPGNAMLIGLSNSLEGALGGWLFRRWKISRHLDRPRDVALFIALVFLVLQPISSTGGVLAVCLLGQTGSAWASRCLPWWIAGVAEHQAPAFDVLSAWRHWWIANSIGQLVVTPLLLAWSTAMPRVPAPRWRHDMLLWGSGILVAMLFAASGSAARPLLPLTLSYGVLLFWIGQGPGLRCVTLVNVLITTVGTWAGATGHGFLAGLPAAERFPSVGFFSAAGCGLCLMVFAMFEERRALIERLTELASTDALVQISNRRHFIEMAEREVEKARASGIGAVFLMLDVDHFKEINDRYGHAAGDLTLKSIAHSCSEAVDGNYLVGRLGGEEFALLLTGMSLEAGRLVAERLRELIAGLPVHVHGRAFLNVTVSIGVAQLVGLESLDVLMRAADSALYTAKQNGRNRVMVWRTDRLASPCPN
ncbi:diguanylate cyclase [Cupriavidus sp. 30B13]|uniref:sensor domain-containing diguanylate cyclase n=1 Tax=Cupriavidus sp. 30B13 TaxID=3384241 RepID=UPI003CF40DA9